MYCYEIGYGTCEESEYRQYFHKEKYSSDELDFIVLGCLKVALPAELKKTRELYDGRDEFLKKMDIRDPSVQDLFNNEFRAALKDAGFNGVKFEASYSVFGWGSSIKPEVWSEYRSDKTVRLCKALKAHAKKECDDG